jgi:hypothetical protein
MSRKPDPEVRPNDTSRVASPRPSSAQRSSTESLPPEQPGPADEWIVTHCGGIVERLARVVVLGSPGNTLRNQTLDEILMDLSVRAAARTPGNLPHGDMAVWKGTRLRAYLRAEAVGGFTVCKIN